MKWWDRPKKLLAESGHRIYLKWFTIITMVAMIPIIMLSIFIYVKNIDEKQEIINKTNGIYLEQTASMVDIILSQIRTGYVQLTVKESFVRFEQSQLGAQYENARATGQQYSTVGLEWYLDAKNQVLEDLNVMRNSNKYIHSIYFYDNDKKLIVTDNEIVYSFSNFIDKEWYKEALEKTAFPAVLNTVEYDETDTMVPSVSLVFRSPNEWDNMFVVNIDCKKLFSDILGQSKIKYNSLAVLYNNKIVYATNEADGEYLKSMSSKNTDKKSGSFFDENTIISYLHSNEFPFLFLTAMRVKELYSGVRYVQWGFIGVTLLLLIVSCVFAFLASKRMYRPYSYVMEKLGGNRSYRGENDMQIVEQIVSRVFEEKQTLLNKLDENNNAYKEKFISSLVVGNNLGLNEISSTLHRLNINLPMGGLYLVVFDLMSTGYGDEQSYYDITANQIITERIIQLLADKYVGVMAQVEVMKFALILHIDADKEQEIRKLASDVIEAVECSLDIRCNAAISSRCVTIKELPQAYAETVSLLSYHSFSATSQVFDNESFKSDALAYPSYEMRRLCEAIERGNRETAIALFSHIDSSIREARACGQHVNIKSIFIRMINELETCALTMGYHLEEIVGEGVDIYADVSKLKDIDLIFELMFSIIDTLLSMAAKEQNHSNRYIRQIIDILDNDCGPEVALSTIAETVGISSAYISRLFKNQMGITFMDYLTKVRMEKAKRMLTDARVKVKDVAESLGYSNSDYFIHLFKKHTGMTPSAYKKMISD